ncbi:Uncharacterised protein [Salmonella enterica subsp. enterica serovar Bovismorbificans]|nr:Uncharacterised protein [Salmonella enterica subsp. enterica serovar Bovismorbificans]
MFQLAQNGRCGTGNFTWGVDILDANAPNSALRTGL